VLDAEALDSVERWGRYLDLDGDGIGYRTYPGTHPERGAFFTRGTSRDEFAAYTESPEAYVKNMDRLSLKWRTAATLVPKAEIATTGKHSAILYYGTSALPMGEALDLLAEEGIHLDTIRVRAFPFGAEVHRFIDDHDVVFVVDQNRDAQMRTLLINEGEYDPAKLVPITYYGGLSISADTIQRQVSEHFTARKLPRLTEVKS
jgi:2-oxoglutarate ferredoxin oxidoreductase subunit alpha